ncbi:gliding motility-associated-like protein [Flavobacterium sp. 28YEA47A]|uniref:fibronectin type III domain-containing protein n=1 Tax=Flavobacterium sp. 28YEA47A TaxID=3156276 RepID=UPI0035124DFE
MKKITLLLLTFFISLVAYGQGLTENFDGGTSTALPTGWDRFNVGGGANPRYWLVNTQPNFSASAPNSAFIQNYQIGQGNTSRDWLTTTRITLPENAQLQFLTRAFLNQDQGTIYEVRVSRDGSQGNLAAYTLAEDWTEPELNPDGIYQVDGTTPRWDEKTVNLKALGYNAGEQVYIAFVRVFTQPTAALGGDRWYVDDVRVSKKCEMPINMQAPTINMTNAILTWNVPTGGANDFELIVVRDDQTMEQGTIINVTGLTYTINGLTPDTNYKYYIRAVCSASNKSDWTAPYFFTTAALGETCTDPIVMPGIPYSTNNNTSNSNDRTDVAQGTGCGAVPATTNYMTGNEVFYSFVAPTTGDIRVIMTPTGPNSGVFVYNSCANVGVSCIAGVANTGSGTRIIPAINVVAGQTYIVVISSTSATQTVGYYLELQYVTCPAPTNLSAPTITQSQVTLAWNNPDPAYDTWEVAIQPAGASIPGFGVHGAQVTTNRDFSTTLAGAPIVGSTAYQYWVRALCVAGGTTYSPWAGPFEFFTPICDPTLPNAQCIHNFRLTGTNGWQGAVMHVRQNGITVKVLGPQFTSGTSLVVPVPLCNGIPFELVWVSGGTAQASVGIVVQNSFGQLLYQKTAGTGAPGTAPLHTEMVDCEFPKCPPPINLGATGITASGATLTWTPASLPSGPTTEWEIYLDRQDIAVAPSNTAAVGANPLWQQTTVRPNPQTGLASDTPYVFYLRTICGPNRTSAWVGPYTFRTAVSCGIPTNQGVRGQTTSSAELFWTQPALGGASAWQVVVQGPAAGVPAYNDPRAVNLGNGDRYGTGGAGPALNPATQYEYYVRAVCSTSPLDVSRWVGPFLFTTACEPIPVPYSEGFNSNSTRQLCWSVLSVLGTNTWNMDDTATPFEGNEAATFTPNNGTNNDDWLISPVLDLRQNYRLRYKYKVASATAANTLEIRISRGGRIAPADFDAVPLWTGSLTNTAYKERIINLVGEGGASPTLVNIAFRVPPGTNNANKIFIDDVVFEPIPACPDPMDMAVVTGSITSTSAQISWTPGYQETQWQVAVQPIGTGVPSATFAGAVTTNNINFLANTNTVTGAPLVPGSQYEVYVRAICADPNVSQWVGPIVFRTLLCETADLCPITFTMTDTASNGWGSTMSVYQNGLLVTTLTGPPSGSASTTQQVLLCPGVQYILRWDNSTAGNIGQVGVSITNFYGDVVFTKPPGIGAYNTQLYAGMPFCSPITCPYPTNLAVEQTSGSSVRLSWTPGGAETRWEYVVAPAPLNYPGNVNGTVVPGTRPEVNVRDLVAAVPYEYYVRAVCADGSYSYWSGPFPFTIYNSPGCLSVDVEGIDVSLGDPEIVVCPNDPCVDLSATYYQTLATNIYTVDRIDYRPPFPFSSGSAVQIDTDDKWSPLVTLPFKFCFFGNSYDKLLVGDNGAITFSIAGLVPGGRYSALGATGWQYNTTVPNNPANITTPPYVNAIFGVMQDLDPRTTAPAASPPDRSINYTVLGTAPCRAFVMNIYKLGLYNCNQANGLQTSQIVLYEGSNIIDIYIENRPSCGAHNTGSGVIGIQNANGTVGYTPPGRNTGAWTTQNEAWRFTPAGNANNVIFSWLKDDAFYSNDLDINVCVTGETKMTAQALYPSCDPTVPPTRKFIDIKIKIDDFPINNPRDLQACTGTTDPFDVTVNTPVILDGVANATDYEISYYLTLAEAEDGSTPGITSVITTVDIPVFVRIEKISTGCFVTRQFEIKPNLALPEFTVTGDRILCEGDSTTITVEATNFDVADADFEWTLPDGTVSSQTGSTFNITGATAADGGTYSVKVTTGCDESLDFTVRVNQIDTDFTYPTPVCPSGTISPTPVTAATFTTGGSYSISPGLPIDPATGVITLDGATAGDYVITYTVTPAITNCTDDKTGQFTITIAGTTIQPVVAFNYTTPVCKSATTNPMPILAAGFTTGGQFTSTDPNVSVNISTGEINLANTQPGSYTINYLVPAVPAECKAGGTENATIVITAAINPVTSFGYADDSFCSGGVQVGQLPTGTFDAGGRFTVEPSTGLNVNPTTGEFMPGTSTPGTYVIKYIIEADPALCRSRSESPYSVTIENTFDITVTDECRNNEYVLIAEPSDPSYTFVWKDALGVPVGTNSHIFNVSQYVANLSGQPQYPMTFTITMSTATGCQNVKEVRVESTFCDIQKGISPNNDGKNDYFDLAGFNVKKLSIFNRYGTEVYSRTNYTNQWRGQSNKDKELPDGTYYYVIERSGVPSKTGWIQINRQTK